MSDKTLPFSQEDVTRIANEIPTPFYLIDEAGIQKRVQDLYAAFSWNPGFREHFAVKANPNPAILKLLKSLGCGTDCASVPEIILSQRAGITGRDIMFTSNDTSVAEFQAAFRAGAVINLDDITHVQFLQEACGIPKKVCCRYTPREFAISTNSIMGSLEDTKFGMTKDQLIEALKMLKAGGAEEFGIHSMPASNCLDEDYYPCLAEMLLNLALEIREKTGITLSFIDMAGGVGIPYRPEEKEIDIFAVGRKVKEVFDRIAVPNGLHIAILTEMGRYIAGPCGYLVTKCLHVKQVYKTYVGVDATACDLMRPAIYGAYHHITVLGKEREPLTMTCDVTGSLCENNDKFAVSRNLPQVVPGDILVIHDAGAHGRSMGYNYNGKLRCAEVMLRPDGSHCLIRRAETAEDYFATLDIYPEYRKERT